MTTKTLNPITAGIFDQIIEPLRKKEGFRHLFLGDSGMGKTVATDELLKYIRRKRLVDLTLTVDDKSAWEIQYGKGSHPTVRVNPADLRANRPRGKEDASHVIFRGIAATKRGGPGIDTLVEDVFQMAWELVREKPSTVLINLDELADATNRNQKWLSEICGATYGKGRAVGISLMATTQLPQLLPRDAFGLSETMSIFRMTTREAAYLAGYQVIPKDEVEPIGNLEVGDWRFFRKSRPLDPNIYKCELGGNHAKDD